MKKLVVQISKSLFGICENAFTNTKQTKRNNKTNFFILKFIYNIQFLSFAIDL